MMLRPCFLKNHMNPGKVFFYFHKTYSRFFYKQRFFNSGCLTFSWIELQILLRCCLIHISIIIVRQFLYILDTTFYYIYTLCPWLDLGLFISYHCDLFFIFIFISAMINGIISWIQTHSFFCLFFRISHVILRW